MSVFDDLIQGNAILDVAESGCRAICIQKNISKCRVLSSSNFYLYPLHVREIVVATVQGFLVGIPSLFRVPSIHPWRLYFNI